MTTFQKNPKILSYHEREIWWVRLGKNTGWEESGAGKNLLRPVLVIRKFQKELFWGIPLTQTIRSGNYFYTLSAQKCSGQLILPQLRALDSVRLVRKIERIDQEQFKEICKLIRRLLEAIT